MNILDIPMQKNDAGAATIKDYLKALLDALWNQGEGFSGKRPFGNSGWEYELYQALVASGVVRGDLNEDGSLDDYDELTANKLIFQAIKDL